MGEDERMFMCPFMNAIPCRYGECYRCKDCENNPETWLHDPEMMEIFEKAPWSLVCLTCGELVENPDVHPGHLLATGLQEYHEKIPEMIMDRMKRRNEPNKG